MTADQIAKWKAAIAASHKQQRQRRGRRAGDVRIGPGMVRRAVRGGKDGTDGHHDDDGQMHDLPTVTRE